MMLSWTTRPGLQRGIAGLIRCGRIGLVPGIDKLYAYLSLLSAMYFLIVDPTVILVSCCVGLLFELRPCATAMN